MMYYIGFIRTYTILLCYVILYQITFFHDIIIIIVFYYAIFYYDELNHIAVMSGVLNEDKTRGCAYAIKTEKLFEEFTMFVCQEFAKQVLTFYLEWQSKQTV